MEEPSEFWVLYICDIDHLVEEQDLWQAFAPWTHSIISIRFNKDIKRIMGASRAYVNFASSSDALVAYQTVQPLFLSSSYCRVTPYNGISLLKPPRVDPTTGCGIFIKNLDLLVGPASLWGAFRGFGTIIGCRIAIDDFGDSRGFAYITYSTNDAATAAIGAMNGKTIGNSRINVSHNIPKSQRVIRVYIKIENGNDKYRCRLNESQIIDALSEYGHISCVAIPQPESKKPKNYAIAMFDANANTTKAIEEVKRIAGIPVELNIATGTYNNHQTRADSNTSSGSTSEVGEQKDKAQDVLTERKSSTNFSQPGHPGGHKRMPVEINTNNLFVRPIYNDVSEADLLEVFSKYGKVIETKVIQNNNGFSRGYGFVKFETTQEAVKASDDLNGKTVFGNELCVAPAQTKMRRYPQNRMQPRYMYPSPMGPGVQPSQTMYSPYPVYYIPVEYAYMPQMEDGRFIQPNVPLMGYPSQTQQPISYGNSEQNDGHANSETQSETERIGEELLVHVNKHKAINGDSVLASMVTGLLLQQNHSEILKWLKNESTLNKRIQQAYNAYSDWKKDKE